MVIRSILSRTEPRRFARETVRRTLIAVVLGALLFAWLPIQGQEPVEAPTPRDGSVTEPVPARTNADMREGIDPAEASEFILGQAAEFYEDTEAGTQTFIGNVRFDRADDSGYLYAQKVVLYRDTNSDDRAVQRMVAEDDVRLREGDLVAQCDLAVFTEGMNVIDLEGSVVVLMTEDRMESEHFNYDRRTGKRHASGGVRFRFRLSNQAEETAPVDEQPGENAAPEDADATADAE